jgi:very-long-chain (3R)-3-hydroxyacyl-CoA dehydratase
MDWWSHQRAIGYSGSIHPALFSPSPWASNEIKRNQTKSNEIKRNQTKSNEIKRNHQDYSTCCAAFFQMVSLLEVFHALFGLVRGSPVAALMQWMGRANVLFNVILPIPSVCASAPAGAMVLAWALSEVVRYPWYTAQLKGTCPFWLTWLRYTMFIPLYPVGVLGEIMSIYNALPILESQSMYSVRLPNAWNFGFDYAIFMKIVLILYPFLWWQLYAMLLKTRSKKLPKLV